VIKTNVTEGENMRTLNVPKYRIRIGCIIQFAVVVFGLVYVVYYSVTGEFIVNPLVALLFAGGAGVAIGVLWRGVFQR
jgi:hypothetical protein